MQNTEDPMKELTDEIERRLALARTKFEKLKGNTNEEHGK
jgi:hypothetical protein